MDVTIENLQAYLADRYTGYRNDQGLFMKLVEEVGEVAEILNQRAGYKAQDKADLDKELAMEIADILHYAIAIAAVNHLPLNDILLEKDRQASIKYQHTINLEQFIQSKAQS